MTLTIQIRYKLIGRSEWFEKSISPSDYFELEPGEVAGFESSLPRYDHAIEYLDGISVSDLDKTQIQVTDETTNKRSSTTEVFWNGGKHRLIECRDNYSEADRNWELILDVTLTEQPRDSLIMRIGRQSEMLKVLTHVIIRDNDDGTESTTDFLD